jgi:hypothetical protein
VLAFARTGLGGKHSGPGALAKLLDRFRDRGIELRLEGLAPSAARKLVAAMIGDARAELGGAPLTELAEGNIFYLVELARDAEPHQTSPAPAARDASRAPEEEEARGPSTRERSTAGVGGGAHAEARGGSEAVDAVRGRDPSTVVPEPVLVTAQARLERLGAAPRRALRAASVFGRVFWVSAIATLLGAEAAATLGPALAALVEAGLVERYAEPRFLEEEEYAFRQAIVRDAAYAMLTERDRTAAHLLAAEWLESRGERDAIVLAEHFARGGEPKSAVVWYLWAAEQALEANDLATVVVRTRRGIASGADGSTLGELLLLQAEAVGWSDAASPAAHAELATSSLVFLTPGTGAWCRAAAQVVAARARAGDLPAAEAIAGRLAETPQQAPLGTSHVLAMAHAAAELYEAGLIPAGDALVAKVAAAVPDPATFVLAKLAHEDDVETIAAASRWLSGLSALYHGEPGALAEAGASIAASLERAGHTKVAALAFLYTARALRARGAADEASAWARRTAELAARIGLRRVAHEARDLIAPRIPTVA